MENQIILDLDTLKYIQAVFKIHSDHSCSCNGYRSLENLIKGEEKANHNLKREDIESFGFSWKWEDGGEITYTLDTFVLQIKRNNTVEVYNNRIENKYMSVLFRGKIKNKSELKRVLQQLEII